MKLATILGSIGCSIDLIGAWWIARSFITARSWEIAEGATQCWGYNPYVLRERSRQAAEAKVGAIFLFTGFFLNLCAWYMSEFQFTVKISWCFALILFAVTPCGMGVFAAKILTSHWTKKVYEEAHRQIFRVGGNSQVAKANPKAEV